MKLKNSCVACFCGLSVGSRIEMVNLLKEKGKLSVSQIAGHFKLRQPTITHHLQYLKTVGLLDSQKAGRQVFYFLKPRCRSKECYVCS